jgi:hypothetical protein
MAIDAKLMKPIGLFALAITATSGVFSCSGSAKSIESTVSSKPLQREEDPPAFHREVCLLEFAHKLDESLRQGRSDVFDESFDVDAVVGRALSGFDLATEFVTGFTNSAKNVTSIGKRVLKDISENSAAYSFLRLHEVSGESRALFRIKSKDGLNYHDLVLVEGGPHGARIVDIYIYISGELFSETLRKLYFQAFVQTNRNALQRPNEQGKLLAKNTAVIKAMQTALARHNFELVLEFWGKLPLEIRMEKVFLIQRITAASALGLDDEHNAAVSDFSRIYPNDPALPLITMSYYSSQGRFDDVMKMIDSLDSVVDDPYLDVMRASAFIKVGDMEGAERLAFRAIKRDPGIEDAYWTVVTIRLNTRNHDSVYEILQLLEDKFSVTFEDLESVEAYSEFVKSQAYRKWKLAHTFHD